MRCTCGARWCEVRQWCSVAKEATSQDTGHGAYRSPELRDFPGGPRIATVVGRTVTIPNEVSRLLERYMSNTPEVARYLSGASWSNANAESMWTRLRDR